MRMHSDDVLEFACLMASGYYTFYSPVTNKPYTRVCPGHSGPLELA